MKAAKVMPMDDWYAWKEGIWNTMAKVLGYPGLAPLEQWMWRSKKERRCVECGEPGIVQHKSVIVPSVSHFWMCQECHDYWENKG